MGVKKNISRILFIALWCAVGAGLLVLLGASISYRNNKVCKGYKIDISGPTGELFIDNKEIEDLLNESGVSKGKGRAIQSFDLRKMEAVLEKSPWIQDAQLYFDNNEVLRVKVLEREPVARVFTQDGSSFYTDSSGAQLPLSKRVVAKLPVFTGYPSPKIRVHGADSLLTLQVCRIGNFIRTDPFWMAQIAQIDITPARNFQMIPMIGDHLIQFGSGDDYQQKFRRLFIFYKEVLSRTGFDKYSRINVEYAGQVIGTRKGSEGTRYDSLQGIKNIQQLIKAARQLQPDTLRERNMKPLEQNTLTEQTLTNYDLIQENGDSAQHAPVTRLPAAAVTPPAKPNAKPASGSPAATRSNRPAGSGKPAPGKGGHTTAGARTGTNSGKPAPRAVMPAKQ